VLYPAELRDRFADIMAQDWRRQNYVETFTYHLRANTIVSSSYISRCCERPTS
jgi:hypothetical protein